MIHTVKIDDNLRKGRQIVTELNKHPKGIEFENFTSTVIAPEGYMTSEEFEKRAMEKVNKFCDKHGIL